LSTKMRPAKQYIEFLGNLEELEEGMKERII
jgi:hypothetical protein